MRERGDILNRSDRESRRLKSSDRALSSGTRSLDLDFDVFDAELGSSFRAGLGSTLGSKGSALPTPFEPGGPCGRPAEDIPIHIGDRDECVIKRCLDMGNRFRHITPCLFLFGSLRHRILRNADSKKSNQKLCLVPFDGNLPLSKGKSSRLNPTPTSGGL